METPAPSAAESPAIPLRPLLLSVIIPGRNEEASLPACLASLLAQSEPGFALGRQWELILVNDDSTDRTRDLAAEAAALHPGITLLDAPPLDLNAAQRGATGKTKACWIGAQQAGKSARWLLFTDADTVHEPGNLSRALHEAEKYKVELLSYSPRQLVTGLWQRALMPLVFSELAIAYPPRQVNDPASHIAAANGQFLLIARETYFAVGGHRALTTTIEDVELAQNVKRNKYAIRFRYAADALSTHMYRNLQDMIEGWTKNLALLFSSPVWLAVLRLIDLLLLVGLPLVLIGMPMLLYWKQIILFLLWVRVLWRYYARVSGSNFPLTDCALSVFGIPLFVFLLVRSWMQHRIYKRVGWKGRIYRTTR